MRLNRYALANLRERSGYSKSALARDVGMSVGALADLESGRRNASPSLARRLARALAVPLPAILACPEEYSGGSA
jgi:transcriptional regulator with XRE-family HTH domain